VAAGLRPPVHFGQRASHAMRWTLRNISPAARAALAALPMLQLIDDRFLLVHAALHPVPNDVLRIHDERDALQTLQALRSQFPGIRLCFFGHTHIRAAYRCDGASASRISGDRIVLPDDASCLVNPGSVGWSRDMPGLAHYCTYDAVGGVVTFHKVAYDRDSFERKLAAAGLNHVNSRMGHARCWMRDRFYRAAAVAGKLRAWCSA
jgi:predicted phosphodiesterase